MITTRKNSPSLRRSAVALFRSLVHDLFETYHPERHYMRGPGPKWHAKHAAVPAATADFDVRVGAAA